MPQKIIIVAWFLCMLNSSLKGQKNYEDSLQNVIATSADMTEVVKAYNNLGYEYTRKDVTKAKAYLYTSISISKANNYHRGLSAAYATLMYIMHDSGMPDSAEYYIGQVKNLYETSGPAEKDKMGANYYSVVAMYYKNTSAFNKAIPNFEKAIELYKKIGDRESVAGYTLNMGNNYISLGNYKKATEKHLQALSIFEELGSKRGVSFCYNSLATSFTQLKLYNQALKYHLKSYDLKKELGDRRGMGTAQSGIGDVYFSMKEYKKALVYYNNGLAVAKEMNNRQDEKPLYLVIAKTYRAMNEVAKAEDYFLRYKDLSTRLNDSSGIAAADAELIALKVTPAVLTDSAGRQINMAEENKMNQAFQLFQERGDLSRQAAAYQNMVDFYSKNKDFEKALFYLHKYHEVSDSIRNTELQLQVLKMEEAYTSVKKENEIQLLRKDQELQQQKLSRQRILFGGAAVLLVISLVSIGLLVNRNKLKQRMKEIELRNQIAADLHDEVGSSLSSIHLLSQMATQQDNETRQKEILARMSSNAKETMDKMGDLVWTIKPEEAEGSNLKQRMERFAYEICGASNIGVTMQLDKLDTKDLTMEQRKNIYLIFKEALNNAVKYSGTEKIYISAANGQRMLTMIVKDEGRGFDSLRVKKGNGLNNIHNRAAGIGGELTVDSQEGKGTIVKLVMPLTL